MKPELIEVVMETLAGFRPEVSDMELMHVRAMLSNETLRRFVEAGYSIGVAHGSADVRDDRHLTVEQLMRRGENTAWAIVSGHDPAHVEKLRLAVNKRTTEATPVVTKR